MAVRSIRLKQIAQRLKLPLYGPDMEIQGLGLCNRTTVYPSILSYITAKNYLPNALDNSGVKALILTQECYRSLDEECKQRFSWLISDKPEEDFYRIHDWLGKQTDFYEKPDFSPLIGTNCEIHPTAVIENGVVIGNNVTIGPHSVIRRKTRIDNDTYIGCCTVIGSSGFQIIRTAEGTPFNAWHAGGTHIGSQVWIGDNVTVGNALFEGEVLVDDHVQIDNHCYIAHNCKINQNSVLTANVLLLGSSTIEENCWLGPGSMVLNRIVIQKHATIGANSLVNKNVQERTTVIGSPAIPIDEFIKHRKQS